MLLQLILGDASGLTPVCFAAVRGIARTYARGSRHLAGAALIRIRRSALVRQTPEVMFDLVNDVEAYPRRFAWCAGSAVLERDDHTLVARLDVRLAGFTQSFTTRNTPERPARIHMEFVEGPFRALTGDWTFLALADSGCKIAFALDFDYSGRIAAQALSLGFQTLADRMVDDFCREAARDRS